ncbi:MAG: NADH-quinone oxidoreductase subunit J [Neisseriaceae bacterium]|nr:NADH-quinone oxidoreductase subunit J [Neisseriaceae bacterium]
MASLVVGTIYFGLMFILAGFFFLLAMIFPKKTKEFLITAGGVLILFIFIIPLQARLSLKIQEKIEEPIKAERRAKYEQAKAVFDEQCKKAGEKIYRTVDNVDGIILLKIWKENDTDDYWWKLDNPMWEYAAWDGSGGRTYIGRFLLEYSYSKEIEGIDKIGYKYVDVSNNEQFFHYIGGNTNQENWKEYKSNEEIISKSSARYAVTFETDVNPELRKYWVAGVTFKIIDLQTNELLAEKTMFNFSQTLGKRMHGQSWTADNLKCGLERSKKSERKLGENAELGEIAEFVFFVLKPQS